MARNMIEINVNDYRGDFLLLDSYLQDEAIPFATLHIPQPTITATFAPEALHLDKLGFKMCTILSLARVTTVSCIFKEGSPHSIQIPLMVQEATDNTRFPRASVRYFSWDKGLFSEVDDRSIRLCRHAGEVSSLSGLFRLRRYMERLRAPAGCPNDRDATLETTLELMKEELGELIEAVQGGQAGAIVEELGDLMFDVLLFSFILENQGVTSFSKVCDSSTDKMLNRHPSVEEKASAPR